MNKDTKLTLFYFSIFVVFTTLKLTEVIDWSWWWIFAPLWVPFVGFLILAWLAVMNFLNFVSKKEDKKEDKIKVFDQTTGQVYGEFNSFAEASEEEKHHPNSLIWIPEGIILFPNEDE